MGLIAHYRLDGDAADAVGDHGGVVSGSPSWVSSKLGQGMKSDGTSTGGYISQPSVSDYLHGRPEASISMWVKKDALQYGFFQLSGFKNSNGNIYPYNSSTRVYLDTFRTNRLGPISMHSSVLEWHHFCVTQKPGEWKLYQNGELVHSASADSQISTDYLQFEIGRNSGNRYANGQFDDVRIYDHALSPREVRDLSLGLMSRYRLHGDTNDEAGTGLASIDSGAFVDSDVGIVADVVGTSVSIALEHAPLNLKGETILFREKCDFLRSDALGGGFNNRIIQWGNYNSDNSGGFGLQSGDFSYYLRGPSSSRWTDNGAIAAASQRYDLGGWIDYAVVFGEDDTISLYMDGDRVSHFPLSVPYTGLDSAGVLFGFNMLAKVSDVRIYATALTPAQVKELYQQRASIDSEGNLHVS